MPFLVLEFLLHGDFSVKRENETGSEYKRTKAINDDHEILKQGS